MQRVTENAKFGKLPPVEKKWKFSGRHRQMLLLWPNGSILLFGHARMRSIHPKNPLVGMPQSFAMWKWASVDAFIMADWLYIGFRTCEDAQHPSKKPVGRYSTNGGKKFWKSEGSFKGGWESTSVPAFGRGRAGSTEVSSLKSSEALRLDCAAIFKKFPSPL